jgi:hypothetical protein
MLNPANWWFHLWHNWIDVWHNLTQGQATLLGGLAVLLAALVAFSTGWFDRRIKMLRYHYEDVKAVYAEALELAYFFSTADHWQELDEERVKVAVNRLYGVSARMALTGKARSADMLLKFANQQSDAPIFRSALERAGLKAFAQALRSPNVLKPGPITYADVEQQLRRELATYLPFTDWRYRRTLRKRIPEDQLPNGSPAESNPDRGG